METDPAPALRRCCRRAARNAQRKLGPIMQRFGGTTMEIDQTKDLWREAVGIFHSSIGLQDAIDELLSSGFHRSELSLWRRNRRVERSSGTRIPGLKVLAEVSVFPAATLSRTECLYLEKHTVRLPSHNRYSFGVLF